MPDLRQVAIVGVAESDLGVTGKTKLELLGQAVSRSLADAGLTLADVDGLATNDIGRFPTVQLASHLGIQPRWTDSTFSGGSTWVRYVGAAADAIALGRADTVLLAYGSDQRSADRRKLGGVSESDTAKPEFQDPYLPLNPMSMYAMAAQRHMHEFGTTEEDLAEIAVAARQWALLNPAAYRYGAGELTVADVLDSPMISSPLKAADCCLVTDGGAGVVLTTLERARDLTDHPVVVAGHGEATTHDLMAHMPDLTWTGAADAGARAFAMAGLTPADVDVAQLYDSFTITVALTLEALGFCDRGAFPSLTRGGRIAPGGDLPLNTSGGGLSYCHPGQLGLLLVVEAVRQLRGQCGDRQVPGNPEVALVHGTGGILSTHATALLGRDR
jgi:acetyl-CoA acetyltransferase